MAAKERQAVRPSLHRKYLRLFRAAYFFLFGPLAVEVIYWSVFLRRRGLDDAEIGVLVGISGVVAILSPLVWGTVADRWGDRKGPFALLLLGSALAFPLYLLVHSFPAALAVALTVAFFRAPVIPFLDAITVDFLQRHGGEYGKVRLWGSWGFITPLVLFLFLLPLEPRPGLPGEGLLPAFGVYVLCQMANLLLLPWLPAARPSKLERAKWRGEVLGAFLRRRFLLFGGMVLLAAFSTRPFYTFFGLYLEERGIPDALKGLFMVVGVLAEVVFMGQAGRLMERIRVRGLMLVGLLSTALRSLLFALPLNPWGIAAAELLHGPSFGGFHLAAVAYLARAVPPSLRTLGQALYTGPLYGVGGALGSALAGYVSEAAGLRAMYGLCGLLGLGVAGLAMRWFQGPEAEAKE